MNEKLWTVSASQPDGRTFYEDGVTDDELTEALWELLPVPPFDGCFVSIEEI